MLKSIILVLCFVVVIFIIACRYYMAHQSFDLKAINFNKLDLPNTPNYCLVAGNITGSRVHPTKTYDVSAQRLRSLWHHNVLQTPRMSLLKQFNAEQSLYVVRSAIFLFPDLVQVNIKEIGVDKSQLMIYSHAVYGYSDFGVNCSRVNKWLVAIDNERLKASANLS